MLLADLAKRAPSDAHREKARHLLESWGTP